MGTISTIIAKGLAFLKLVDADASIQEAKLRIEAIDASNKANAELVAFYEKESTRVHADADKIKSDLEAILAKL